MKNYLIWLIREPIFFCVTVVGTLIAEHIFLSIAGILRTWLLELINRLYRGKKLDNYVKNYYTEKECFHDLFKCVMGEKVKEILFLSADQWHGFSIDVYANDNILEYEDRKVTYKHSRAAIWIRKNVLGQYLINSPALYFIESKEPQKIIVGTCDYFQKITLVDKMEGELLLDALFNLKRTKQRDEIIKNFDMAVKRKRYPISIGCDVAMVINLAGKRRIVIQERSKKTASYGGRLAVVPSFGFCPFPQNRKEDSDSIKKHYNNLLLYNIVKEYCEEIYNVKEMENYPAGHANPFWLYENVPQAQELMEALESKKAFCTYLGFGFDAINGMSNLAVLLYIEDEKLSEKIYEKSVSNWEYRNNETNAGFKFIDVASPVFGEYLEENYYQSETAFSLALALKELQRMDAVKAAK